MNKYLMLSAAALIATTAGAHAKGKGLTQFTFGTAGGGEYCDGGTIHKASKSLWGWTHNYEAGCGYSYNAFGLGVTGKNKQNGDNAAMSDNTYSRQSGITINYVLPKNMKAGGTWTLYLTEGGTSTFEGNSGVLIAGLPGHVSHHSSGEVVRKLINKS